MKNRVFLFGFSAIIGTGKTSAMKRLEKEQTLQRVLKDAYHLTPYIVFVLEPEDMWVEKASGDINWLHEFYADRNLNAHPFQLIVFDTHVTVVQSAIDLAQKNAQKGQDICIVVERTMYDQLLFWKQQVDDKLLTTGPIFDASYMRMWRRWLTMIPPVSGIFFLKTDNLQQVMQRLRKREEGKKTANMDKSVFYLSGDGIEEEINEAGGIPLAYQQALLKRHEEWFTTPFAHPPEAPSDGIRCVHLNANANYHTEDAQLEILAGEMAKMVAEVLSGGGELK